MLKIRIVHSVFVVMIMALAFIASSLPASQVMAQDVPAVVADQVIDSADPSIVDSVPFDEDDPLWYKLWLIFAGVVSVAASIAAVTKTDRDNRVVGKLLKIVDFFALNIGGARNANRRE